MTPDERFDRCVALVLSLEGGATYTNKPLDKGGPTRFGVTLKTLSDWRGKPCTAEDVKCLPEAEARRVYRERYWDAVRGDELPAGVDLVTFDAGVNCGPHRAVVWLQSSAGVTADGVIGPVSLMAIRAVDPRRLVDAMRLKRDAYYRLQPDFPVWGRGWLARLNTVALTAKAWAAKVGA